MYEKLIINLIINLFSSFIRFYSPNLFSSYIYLYVFL